MAHENLIAEVKMAWWFKYYLFGLVITSKLLNRKPDPLKIAVYSRKAVKLVIKHKSATNKLF